MAPKLSAPMQKFAWIVLGAALTAFAVWYLFGPPLRVGPPYGAPAASPQTAPVSSTSGGKVVLSNTQLPKDPAGGLVRFQSTIRPLPFEVSYPADWYVHEEFYELGRTTRVLFTPGLRPDVRPDQPAVEILAFPYELEDGMKWEDMRGQTMTSLQEKGMQIAESVDLEISRRAAFRIDYGSPEVRSTLVEIRSGDGLYEIRSQSPPVEFEQYRERFEKILSSVRWIGSDGAVRLPVPEGVAPPPAPANRDALNDAASSRPRPPASDPERS